MLPLPPISTLFPYTTLFRSTSLDSSAQRFVSAVAAVRTALEAGIDSVFNLDHTVTTTDCGAISVRSAGHHLHVHLDRKSTRLNSSHLGISYAVFCLKKKNKI